MAKDFGQQVAGYVDAYKKRLRATARQSVQELVEIAQTPRAKGGRMRVDTGFLRASLGAKVGSMPSGESEEISGQPYDFELTAVSAVLLRWDPNRDQTVYIGWTANYARAREYHDGFARGAAERWDETVERVAREVSKRI